MLFLLFTFIFFLLPGLLVSIILNWRKTFLISSFALSYIIALLILLPLIFYNARIAVFWFFWSGITIVLMVVCLFKLKKKTFRLPELRLKGLLIAIIPILLYLAYAGAYTEAPSDFLNHAERFQAQSKLLEQGCFTKKIINFPIFDSSDWSIKNCFSTQGLYWYTFIALIAKLTGVRIQEAFSAISFFTVLSFSSSYYYFTLALLARKKLKKKFKIIISACAVWLLCLTSGVNVFSFMRYYTLAPVMLNFIILFAAILYALRWFEEKNFFNTQLFIIPLAGIATYLIHTQEAILLFFILLALSLVYTVKRAYTIFSKSSFNKKTNRSLFAKTVFALIFLCAVWIILFFVIKKTNSAQWQKAGFILPGIEIPSEPVPIIFKNLPLYAPHNEWLALLAYQGLYMANQVFGLFGALVILLSLFFLRHIARIPYLIAGLLFPFFTNLNPITLDMCMRMVTEPITMYRFFYMVPIPIVGALLIFHLAHGIFSRNSWLRKTGYLCLLLLLLISIFPIDSKQIYAPYSKLLTLKKIPEESSVMLWKDIYAFVEERASSYQTIISDPLTVRLLRAFQNKINNYVVPACFIYGSIPENPPAGDPLAVPYLVIVNLRDGRCTAHSQIAKHWDNDALAVSRFYPSNITNTLSKLTNAFQPIWSSNKVFIFEQKRAAIW
jgi:hypothetical protein